MAEDTKNSQVKKTDTSAVELIRREERRRRRKRNQIFAYLTMIVLVILIIAGVVAAVVMLGRRQPEKPNNNASLEGEIENLVGPEESLEKPEVPDTVSEPEPTPEENLDKIIDAAIEVMPLEDKVAGLFIVTPEAITGVGTAIQAGDGTRDALNKWAVGGLIYFRQNIKSAEQLKEMIANSSLYSRYPLFIAVDEEGGLVSRLAQAGLVENAGGAQAIGATADPAQAYQAGQEIGAYLSEYGFNLDFAPVADINSVEGSIMEDRSYGSDSAIVSSMVASMVQGLEENGVSSCLKHFPGIGSSVDDTHIGLAGTERTAEQFRTEDFLAFQAGIDAGADFVMVSHMAAPAFTGDNTPCTLSREVVTDILREELGFDGVIITDAMNMGAITEYYEADDAAIQALRAGCDMILMPEDFEKAYEGVLEAVRNGTISEERINDSLRRIYRIKYADKLAE